MSTTYGNSTTGTFKHPAEIFNFQKLLSVPNPFNIDLSLYTATAAASASPIKPPSEAHPRSLHNARTLCILETLQQIYALCAVPDAFPARGPVLGHVTGGADKGCFRPEGILSGLCQQPDEPCMQSGRHSRKCPQWRLRQGRRLGRSKDRHQGSSGGSSDGFGSSGSYSGSGDYGGSLSSSAGGGSTPSEPDFTVYPEAPITAPTGLQVMGLDNSPNVPDSA